MTVKPHEIFRKCLTSIMDNYKSKEITIIYKADTAVVSAYGEPTKTITTFTVRALIGAPQDDKAWTGEGLFQGTDSLVALVYEDFTAQLPGEFFNSGARINMMVLIGDTYYRVLDIISPESIHDEVPYWRLMLSKMEEVSGGVS